MAVRLSRHGPGGKRELTPAEAVVGLLAAGFRFEFLIRMGRPPLCIEIATTVSGVSFDECYASRLAAVLDGIPVSVISRKLLIANKRAAGRLKDLADVQALEGRDREV